MDKEQAANWTELLSEEQKVELQWLLEHRCTIEAHWAGPSPLHDLPEGLVLEVFVDKHAIVKARGNDVPGMFDHLCRAARSMFDWVQQYDPALSKSAEE